MKRLTTITLAALISTAGALAQGASFLENMPDAKSLGTAGADAAQQATAFSIWNNAASSVFSEDRFTAGAAYGVWQPSFTDIRQIAVAGYGKLGEKRRWSVNAGIRYYGYQPVELADENGIYAGSFSPYGIQASAGASFRVLPSLAVSATAGYVRSDIGGTKAANAVCLDLGMFFRKDAFSATLVAANLGTALNYGGSSTYALPARLDIGAGYRIGRQGGKHTLDISAKGNIPLAGKDFRAAGGMRYTFNDMINLAAGYSLGLGKGMASYATAGAGIKFYGVSVDLACLIGRSGDAMSGTMILNLSYAF